MNKFVIALLVGTVLALATAQSNHFEMGNKQPGDRQLHYEIVRKSSSILQIVTTDVAFPANGTSNTATIHYIRALDQYINGNGGYVSLYGGGINQKNVTLHFKSQRGHGFNFILEIWGF